ncbi:MAG: cadherin-like domain-containing protein [Gemmataceae bacterium]|nr:cadherin-like domain-containing protein [Gemmataceae bacterium]
MNRIGLTKLFGSFFKQNAKGRVPIRRTMLGLDALETRDVMTATVTGGWLAPPSASDLFNAASASVIGSATYNTDYGIANLTDGNSSNLEPHNTIFADGQSQGYTDYAIIRTNTPIQLDQYRILLGQDSMSNADRSADAVRLYSSLDGINFQLVSQASGLSDSTVDPVTGNTGYAYANNNNWLTVSESFASPVTGQFFKIEIDRHGTLGVRIFEIDGFGSGGIGTNRVTNVFNANTNSVAAGDEAPGLVINNASNSSDNITATTAYSGFNAADAFGRVSSMYEPGNLIFADGSSSNSLTWKTSQAITLAGYQISLGADAPSTYRGAGQVRLYAGIGSATTLIDQFDNGSASGLVSRLFGSELSADTFRIEIDATSAGGPRVGEINAIVGEHAPVAVADGPFSVSHGGTLSSLNLTANDTDADGDSLLATIVSLPAQGTLSQNTDGTWKYEAPAGFIGTTTFQYKVSDGIQDSNVITLTINVVHRTAVWTGTGSDSNASNPDNWNDGVAPINGDDVILNAGSKTIMFDLAGPTSLVSITSTTSYSGDIAIDIPLSITGGLNLASTGILNASSELTLEGGAQSFVATPLVGQMTNADGSVLNLNTNGAPGTFSNGSLSNSGLVAISHNLFLTNFRVNNSASGELRIRFAEGTNVEVLGAGGSSIVNEGTINADVINHNMNFIGDSFVDLTIPITNTGTIQGGVWVSRVRMNAGLINQNQGIVRFSNSASVAALTLSGGAIEGGGAGSVFEVTGAATWSGGIIKAVQAQFKAGVSIAGNVTAQAGRIDFYGAATWDSGNITLSTLAGVASSVTVQGNALLEIKTDGIVSGDAAARFVNNGTVHKFTGGGTGISAFTVVTNITALATAKFDIMSGSVTFLRNTTSIAEITIAANSSITLSGSPAAQTTADWGGTVKGVGDLIVSNDAILQADGRALEIDKLRMQGLSKARTQGLLVPGTISVTNSFVLAGGIVEGILWSVTGKFQVTTTAAKTIAAGAQLALINSVIGEYLGSSGFTLNGMITVQGVAGQPASLNIDSDIAGTGSISIIGLDTTLNVTGVCDLPAIESDDGNINFSGTHVIAKLTQTGAAVTVLIGDATFTDGATIDGGTFSATDLQYRRFDGVGLVINIGGTVRLAGDLTAQIQLKGTLEVADNLLLDANSEISQPGANAVLRFLPSRSNPAVFSRLDLTKVDALLVSGRLEVTLPAGFNPNPGLATTFTLIGYPQTANAVGPFTGTNVTGTILYGATSVDVRYPN